MIDPLPPTGGDEALLRHCTVLMGEALAQIVVANAQTLASDLQVLARREGWSLRPVTPEGGQNVAFKAWVLEITFSLCLPDPVQFRAAADAIDAILAEQNVEPMAVPACFAPFAPI